MARMQQLLLTIGSFQDNAWTHAYSRHTCDMTGFGLPLKGTASASAFRPRSDAFSRELVKISSMGIRINCIMHWTCGLRM